MKTKTQTSETMFKSKVDIDTSDIFFNFCTPIADRYLDFSGTTGMKHEESKYQEYLLEDATNFLDLIYREGITPQDLVDDYLYSRL